MLTSLSSPPSTRHTGRGGASHLRSSRAFCQRCVRRSWRRRPRAARCAPTGAALRADGQLPDDGPQGGDQPLYITTTSEAVSMVLVAEGPDPHALHELGSSLTNGSGSLDPRPVEETEASTAAESQSPEAAMGPPGQGVTGSPGSELPPGAKGRELPRPAPMEINAPDPPSGGPGLSNIRCTSSAKSSTKPRQGTKRSTSYFMQSSLPPGSYTTTSRLTGSQW
jgi:hypothetical protein